MREDMEPATVGTCDGMNEVPPRPTDRDPSRRNQEWSVAGRRVKKEPIPHNDISCNSPPLTLHDDATPPGTARASHTWTSNWSGKRERLHAHAVPGWNSWGREAPGRNQGISLRQKAATCYGTLLHAQSTSRATCLQAESPAAPAPTTRTRRRLASVLIRFVHHL